ncbi:PilW family protein [Pseudoalteromonas sp. MMG010]|uniref:PilW family protein n=1 Tax=Pseudoalteromonas sp. MMG010 TaxID=2822685 RepID=UPI001B39DB30|nr:PilW family protein [Pseudoalteromonas sp. MMG010]MBQ4833062.1 PilW family protein [Pseudoalteromonas sp. MMG010]
MRERGFTLIEMMIALFIGVIILGGVMFTYLSMKITTTDTIAIGEIQESGRLAINIMQRDIEQVGFWGTFYEDSFTGANVSTQTAPAGDCESGLNNASFPNITSQSNFRTIFATTANTNKELNCINNPVKGSDILQIKFLQGKQLVVDITNNEMQSDENYFIAEQEQAQFVRGVVSANTLNLNATVWPYSHHVYYIAEQTYEVNNKKITVPVLMRKRLNGSKMTAESIMEGVENMRFLFGLDTNNDGRIDSYRNVSDMTSADWENRKMVLAVQLFLLVRTLKEDSHSTVKNQTYTLGNDSNSRELSFNDGYRRAVFTTTIRLNNVGANLWHL